MLFISSLSNLSRADEKDKFLQKGLQKELIKKIRTLGDIQSTQNIECDLCGCFFGIEPNYNQNSVGIRYSYFKFENDPVSTTTTMAVLNRGPGFPSVDHETDPNKQETEIYSKIEIVGKYNVNKNLRLLLTIPYKLNDINGKNVRDFGDVSITAQYLLYATEMSLKNESRYRQRVYVGLGIKAPTGAFNKQLTYGITEPHFQPGTGAFDFQFSGTYFAKYKDFGFNADASYSIATTNKNEYQFANRFNANSSVFYQFPIDEVGFLPHAGVYLETAGFDKQSNVEVDDSGGNVLFLTGGLDVYFSSFSLNMTYQYPVQDKLNGSQVPNKFRIITGLSYFLNM